MRHTVRTASQAWAIVVRTQRKKSATPIPTTAAVMMADRRIAVPVASGWNAHTAA